MIVYKDGLKSQESEGMRRERLGLTETQERHNEAYLLSKEHT